MTPKDGHTMTTPATTGPAPGPDEPIPFTLTAKAHAALAYRDCISVVYGWACLTCGAAYFGTPPQDGLCPGCARGGAA